ncbi:orotate phosphoribosyltransferase [Pseudodesulfovibrio tunisiensis]|uniref:orotate phosphoribosyltransferase n=1 Tax=Pseudodesulfovibrio tunisiensis TaxID=463192 RepID=UPI001FB29664|nr:orotate phosphoribosyltransferase [Pseudodesulfovibrio tunisiensis]
MQNLKTKLAKLLLERSYKEGDFTLTSGKKSDFYFDCKQTALHPEGSYLIGKLFFEMLRDVDVKGVGGMTLGADPLISSVTVVSHLEDRGMPGFIIRKKAKGHGTGQYLEGMSNFEPGDKVALLEDVVTTGGTLITAAERVRDAGLEIVTVLSVLDRGEGGRENLRDAGLELRSIFTRQELKDAGK